MIIDLGNGMECGPHRLRPRQPTSIEEYHFADGSVLTRDDLINRMLIGGDGDEAIVGFDNRNDTLSGSGLGLARGRHRQRHVQVRNWRRL